MTQQQIDEMRQSIDIIKCQITLEHERKVRPNVMAHLYVFGTQCLNARQAMGTPMGIGRDGRHLSFDEWRIICFQSSQILENHITNSKRGNDTT
jgi:hypothetical protein